MDSLANQWLCKSKSHEVQHDECDDDAWVKQCENLEGELPNTVYQSMCVTIYESGKFEGI